MKKYAVQLPFYKEIRNVQQIDYLSVRKDYKSAHDWIVLFQCERLQGGLQKIAEASEQLAILNDRLAVQKVAVAEKSEACEIMLEEISTGTVQATEKKSLAESKGKEIEEQNVIIAKEKVNNSILLSAGFPLDLRY